MKVNNGYKYTLNGWTYISIKGTPYERGYAHGQLLAEEIKSFFETFKFNLFDTHGVELDFFIEVSNYVFKKPTQENFPEFFEELKGITDGANENGANITLDELILLNNSASLDYALSKLSTYLTYIPKLQEKYANLITIMPTGAREGGGRKGSDDKCSAFMAIGSYTHDGKIVCAHNSFDNFISGQHFNIIIDLLPDKGHRVLYQAGPGYISSQTDFFVTSGGFIGTETTIGGFVPYEDKDPITCRIRNCMQYANTLDDYVEMLKKNNSGDYANSWLIGDIKNNEIMRIELGLNFVNVERLTDGYFIGFNAAYDARIRNLECVNSGFDDIRRHQGARKVRLEQLMEEHKGKLNVEIAKEIIADHYDVYLGKINPSSRTCCGHYELDDRAFMSQADRPLPYQPRGAVDGTVTDSETAKEMGFYARWGSSCGMEFDKKDFFNRNIQWKRYEPYIFDRPSNPWSLFKSLTENKKNIKIKRTKKKNIKSNRKTTRRTINK